MADPSFSAGTSLGAGSGLPGFVLIGRDMTIAAQGTGYPSISESQIQEALDAEFPDVTWNAPPSPDDLQAASTTSPFAAEESAGDGSESPDAASPFGGGSSCATVPIGSSSLGVALMAFLLGWRRRRLVTR